MHFGNIDSNTAADNSGTLRMSWHSSRSSWDCYNTRVVTDAAVALVD